MKRLWILLALLVAGQFAFGQTVKTRPADNEWIMLVDITDAVDYILVGNKGDGVDTSKAFSLRNWQGAATLAFQPDTTVSVKAASNSDSCLSVGIQFKGGDNLDWGYYEGALATFKAVTNFSKLDTIARANVNVAASANRYIYMEIAAHDPWTWADSARFIFYAGVGDSLALKNPQIGGF